VPLPEVILALIQFINPLAYVRLAGFVVFSVYNKSIPSAPETEDYEDFP